MLAAVGYPAVVRPWHLRWGATDAEIAMPLPGDDLVPNPVGAMPTRAVTIEATPAEIWPWLAQLGADKGGYYSYTWIEALLNCPMSNADRIHPEWQNPQPGDLVKMCPKEFGPPPYEVAAVLPQRAFILGHRLEGAAGAGWHSIWAFVLEPVDADTTRLIVRGRNAVEEGWMAWVEPGVFIMERGLLLGVKARAEG
jgi:hypothetical protein